METSLLAEILRPTLGIVLGGTIGLGFGLLQATAQRRYRKRQENGRLTTGWTLVPGSMSRIAFLLMALALVQVISPALFTGAIQWWVSAGVVAGYGFLLFVQLRRHLTAAAPAR